MAQSGTLHLIKSDKHRRTHTPENSSTSRTRSGLSKSGSPESPEGKLRQLLKLRPTMRPIVNACLAELIAVAQEKNAADDQQPRSYRPPLDCVAAAALVAQMVALFT